MGRKPSQVQAQAKSCGGWARSSPSGSPGVSLCRGVPLSEARVLPPSRSAPPHSHAEAALAGRKLPGTSSNVVTWAKCPQVCPPRKSHRYKHPRSARVDGVGGVDVCRMGDLAGAPSYFVVGAGPQVITCGLKFSLRQASPSLRQPDPARRAPSCGTGPLEAASWLPPVLVATFKQGRPPPL